MDVMGECWLWVIGERIEEWGDGGETGIDGWGKCEEEKKGTWGIKNVISIILGG